VVLASLAIFFLSFVILVPSVGASSGSSQFATYNISGNAGTHTVSAVINETVSPSSSSGMSDVTLQIVSNMANLSYSKILNSTRVILPYFPTVANQSFSYQIHNYSISASIAQSGTRGATFNGITYTLTNYTFSLSGTKFGGHLMNASGGASVFPSGLVYSAWIVANGTVSIHVQLIGTNLSLDSSSSSSQTSSIAVAGGAGSVVAGVGAVVLYKRKNNPEKSNPDEEKPLHHVD
jgi:hypothetical protein